MELKPDKLKELMKETTNGNYNEFSRESGINVGLLHGIVNKKRRAGIKTINAFIDFCKSHDIDYMKYIF